MDNDRLPQIHYLRIPCLRIFNYLFINFAKSLSSGKQKNGKLTLYPIDKLFTV